MEAGRFYRYIKMDRIHSTLTLKLYPDAIGVGGRKGKVELNLGRAIAEQGMRMYHIDQVVAGRQHVAPRAQILLESIGGTDRKTHLRVRTCNGLDRRCCKLHFQIFTVLR